MKYTKAIMLAVLAVFLSAGLTMAAGSEIKMLRASKTPPPMPPEAQKAEQMARQKIPAPAARRLTVEELKQKLRNIPGEREKLDKAKAGVKGKVRRASPTPPPEMQKGEDIARQKIPAPSEKRLTVEELMRELRKIPGEREKLDRINRGYKPTSSWLSGISLSWLNPLSPREAHAATTTTTTPPTLTKKLPVHLFLTGVEGMSNMFYSAASPYAYAKADMYGLYPYKYANSYNSWNYQRLYKTSSHSSRVRLRFVAPYSSWYMITFYAGGKAPAHLNHAGSGWGTVASWNFSSSASYWNYYATIQYLEQGTHYFLWYPDASLTYLRDISIDSL